MLNELTHHSKASKLSGKRLSSLDGLRGIAVLSVIAFHTLRVTGQEGFLGRVLNRVQESAWAGFDLFFVLSGFAYRTVTCISAAVAFLSWHVFEVRFMQLKEYFTYSKPERSEKPSAVSLETQFPYLTGVNS